VSTGVLLLLAQAAASAFLSKGLALDFVTDVVGAALMFFALLAAAWNARQASGRCRVFWILFSVGWGLWLADQLLWLVYDVFLRREIPDLFAGDALLFLAGVPILAGLLLRPHLAPSERGVRLGILDFLLLMVWWVYLYVMFVICWQYVTPTVGFYNANYDSLYLAETLVLSTVIAVMWSRAAGRWKRFYAWLFWAMAFNGAAFFFVNHALEQPSYYLGSWYDLPYAASFLAIAAVEAKFGGLISVPETVSDAQHASWMAGIAMVAVLSLPCIAAATILNPSVPFAVVRFRVLLTLGTMMIMAGLVFLKQHGLSSALKRTNDILEEASLTDPLTGVRNRRYFSATIASDVAQALRSHSDGRDVHTRDLVFYLIDADNFKQVNDNYGHDAGDQVLVEFARRISSAIRNSDVLVRWGGEEFLVLSRYTDRADAGTLAARVLAAVSDKPYHIGNQEVELRQTCSIGWAAFPWLPEDLEAKGYEEVLTMADRGLGAAKAAGKNRAIGMLSSGEQDAMIPDALLQGETGS